MHATCDFTCGQGNCGVDCQGSNPQCNGDCAGQTCHCAGREHLRLHLRPRQLHRDLRRVEHLRLRLLHVPLSGVTCFGTCTLTCADNTAPGCAFGSCPFGDDGVPRRQDPRLQQPLPLGEPAHPFVALRLPAPRPSVHLAADGGARTLDRRPPPRRGLRRASRALPAAPPAPPSFRIAAADLDRDPRDVPGAEAAEDLDQAVLAFDEAYAGLDGLPRLPLPGRIAAARARIAARAWWEPAELATELADLFRMPDGHLAFGYGGHAPLRLAAWPWVGGGASPPEARLALAFPDGSSVGEAAGDPGRAVELIEGRVPRLVLRTFDSAAAAELDRLPAIARRLRTAPAFVVDLRGNGGGNYRYAERFVLELTDARLARLAEREVVSAAAAAGRANSARRSIARGEVPRGALPVFEEHIAALEAEAAELEAAGGGRREIVTEGGVVRGVAPGPLAGRAVFLVDRGCASACEMLLALARQIPGVIVAGEPTRGSMAAGEIALFRLPRSGVTVSLGTRGFRDPLGDFVETRGFLPDVPATGRGAATEAERVARYAAPGLRAARRADLHPPAPPP